MCIYYKNNDNLTYNSQEHVIPAALGCHTKLEKGIVSDQANEYFSPIERDVIEKSFIQIPRIFKGPGKRGKLSSKYATTSEVLVINHGGANCLGYIKGDSSFILNQFIINKDKKIFFSFQEIENYNVNEEVTKLKKQIVSMDEKYVPIDIPEYDMNIYITSFKNKIHIGYYDHLLPEQVTQIKRMFSTDTNYGSIIHREDYTKTTMSIENNYKNMSILVAKTVLNTLAYIKGVEYLTETTDFDNIISAIMTANENNNKILDSVSGLNHKKVKEIREKLHITNDEQACILNFNKKKLSAWVFFYDFGFNVKLCDNLSIPCSSEKGIDKYSKGIICDWRNTKDEILEFDNSYI